MIPGIAYDNGTSSGTVTGYVCNGTCFETEIEGVWVPINYCPCEVFYSQIRKRRFLTGGIVEFCEGWFDEENDRYSLRLIYARDPVGERWAGQNHRQVNIVRRSKNRGRHWDRKSA